MSEPRWISKKALLLLHEESLAEFGGARGLRDEGLLDSALARPRNKYTYESEHRISILAATYCYGIIKNHAFVDGNKRAGFLSIGLFLFANGRQLTALPIDAIRTIMSVASGTLNEDELAGWIEENTITIKR